MGCFVIPHMSISIPLRCLVLVAVALFLNGCAPPPPQTTPVGGLVTLDGQPCAGANVSFIPVGETPGNGGLGQTDETGKFIARLHSGTSTSGPTGLLPGRYKVLINKTVNPDGTPFIATADVAPIDANAKELLHLNYSSFELSKLQAEVAAASLDLKYDLRSDGK
jgi:hypothetical protein